MDDYGLVLNAGSSSLKFCVFVRHPKQEWQLEVDNMVSRGARGTEEEIRRVVEYLAKNLAGPPGSLRNLQRK